MREIDIKTCGQLFQSLREQASSSPLAITVNGKPVMGCRVSDGGNGLSIELAVIDTPSVAGDDIPPASDGTDAVVAVSTR